MNITELKNSTMTIGDPLGNAEQLKNSLQRQLHTLWEMSFLKEDFEKPEDWINGACQQENFFTNFYERRTKKHLSAGFYNEKDSIRELYHCGARRM